MTQKIFKPEDILADDQNFADIDGKKIRKGTVAAALANAAVFESSDSTASEKAHALEAIRALMPDLKALGLTQFLSWKNPEIQIIFDEKK